MSMGNGLGKLLLETKSLQVIVKQKLSPLYLRNIIYTSLFNMIDYPAMVIPVHSAVDPALDPVNKEYIPANARDAETQALCKFFSHFFR